MPDSPFSKLLQGLHAVVLDDSHSCALQRAWLLETGAMVTHSSLFRQAYDTILTRGADFDLLLIDADAHRCWIELFERMRPSCSALVLSTRPEVETLQRVREHGAGYITRQAAVHDFVFAVYNLVGDAGVPHLGRLAARASSMWSLSPQLGRVLHYNLWGYSDRDIADALSISVKTAQQYQDELRRRTGVKSKHAYLRRLLMLAGHEPLLPMTEQTRSRVIQDRELLQKQRLQRYTG